MIPERSIVPKRPANYPLGSAGASEFCTWLISEEMTRLIVLIVKLGER